MNTLVWFLVIFVKWGYAGGEVVVPQPYSTAEACQTASAQIVPAPGPPSAGLSGKATDIEAAFCVPAPWPRP